MYAVSVLIISPKTVAGHVRSGIAEFGELECGVRHLGSYMLVDSAVDSMKDLPM